ncbi:cysteine/Histidine-rich C1 domain family protein [Striga asiatica]|uniref:Cysteine/Histidine-rich C1 domain family protein n=1 Tax=Striga asiatica TaxID=4170 RepID=A0A5A7PF83_STRAF|nr:cysteine/Histidine-rich C1 domain family protein [Striga asiatica]
MPTSSPNPATICRLSSVHHPPPSPFVYHSSSATKPPAAEQEMLLTTTSWPLVNACCRGVRPLALWSSASSAIRDNKVVVEFEVVDDGGIVTATDEGPPVAAG